MILKIKWRVQYIMNVIVCGMKWKYLCDLWFGVLFDVFFLYHPCHDGINKKQ